VADLGGGMSADFTASPMFVIARTMDGRIVRCDIISLV